jgi:hypothetical protein
MAQEELTGGDGLSGETGLQFRTKLNNMFSELYNRLHSRVHSLVSTNDHSPVTGSDKGKFVATNSGTGNPELRFIADVDIPDSLARQTDLENHIIDETNPHNVTAEQLGLGPSGFPPVGGGLNYDESDVLHVYPVEGGGIASNVDTHNLEINMEGVTVADGLDGDDPILISDESEEGLKLRKIPLSTLATFLAGNTSPLQRYVAMNDDTYVEVLASGLGVTATVESGNIMRISIPVGIKLVSVKVRFAGYSTLGVYTGITDMSNDHMKTRWLPIVQAWREDTQQQLTGVTVTMDSTTMDKCTINGLINTTSNQIRMSF